MLLLLKKVMMLDLLDGIIMKEPNKNPMLPLEFGFLEKMKIPKSVM